MEDANTWFKEPSIQDESADRPRNRMADWLSSSTSERAREARRFLNFNISQLPPSWWSRLYLDFVRRDWDDVMLEMFVGRTLQLLEATFTVEDPIKATGRRPDFTATFGDQRIVLEATTIKTNASLREQMGQNDSLVRVIRGLIPSDCSVAVWRLPKLSPADSKRHFTAKAIRLLADAVKEARTTGSAVEVDDEFESGEFLVTVYPQRLSKNGIVTHGMAAACDDTEYRIPRTFLRKKKQVRRSDCPVILAVTTSPMGGALYDFDRALFGHTYERLGLNHEVIEVGFDADGLFSRTRPEPPTYAAALVYPTIGFRNIPDPVLYLNARFTDPLPETLMRLRVHHLEEGIGVAVKSSQLDQLLAPMQFVRNDV